MTFLLLTIRPEDDAAAAEYASVRSATGLEPASLRQLRLDREPLGAALDGVAGVIVGGSPFNAADAEKSATQQRVEADLTRLARTAVDTGLPVFFTCYGIGVAAVALGGAVDKGFGEPVGPTTITLTRDGELDPIFAGLPASFDALVGHKEAVSALPPGAVLLASSAACPVQLFRVGASFYAAQFHPEVTPQDIIDRARIYQHHGYFPVEEFDAVAARVAEASVTVPRRMLRAFVERFA
jgi:GMP synthase (glutamine-hydrolysing)